MLAQTGSVEAVPDLAGLQLEVYASREGGVWHPEHGVLEAPEGWELLPAGDAFVTRRVKAAGLYWSLWQPRDCGHRHRRLVGLLAPAGAIAQARAEAVETAERRAGRRAQGAAYRARKEAGYVDQLTEAVVAYLDFAPRYAELARDIAGEAAGRAGEVGSGRVGRTRTLSLEQRAALAARALIRHRCTDYEDRLAGQEWDDEYLYRAVKADAQHAVDLYLEHHRQPG